MTSTNKYEPGVETGFNLFIAYMHERFGEATVKAGLEACKDRKWVLLRENFRNAPQGLLINPLAVALTQAIETVAKQKNGRERAIIYKF